MVVQSGAQPQTDTLSHYILVYGDILEIVFKRYFNKSLTNALFYGNFL